MGREWMRRGRKSSWEENNGLYYRKSEGVRIRIRK
jgi:hypothetical protein